ncbi:MAG: hypothetical protein OYH77_07040 [Pseudomonadota bacterium]|nr:hypothetical protein [Pseudomonadota bacterium]
MYRTESFDKLLSGKLQNPEFGREFLLSSMHGEDGLDLIDALKRVIACMGVKEYSAMSGIHRASVSRMLSSNETPRVATLNRYLLPFKLRVKIDVEDAA